MGTLGRLCSSVFSLGSPESGHGASSVGGVVALALTAKAALPCSLSGLLGPSTEGTSSLSPPAHQWGLRLMERQLSGRRFLLGSGIGRRGLQLLLV